MRVKFFHATTNAQPKDQQASINANGTLGQLQQENQLQKPIKRTKDFWHTSQQMQLNKHFKITKYYFWSFLP